MFRKESYNVVIKLLKTLKEYWIQITAIVGLIAACSIFPFKLSAMENRQEKLEESQDILIAQTTTIGEYIKGQQTENEYEKERIASAPQGYRWDSYKRTYVKYEE